MDTTRDLPGYVDFIELGGAFEEVFGRFYRASVGWDGKDPVRSFIPKAYDFYRSRRNQGRSASKLARKTLPKWVVLLNPWSKAIAVTVRPRWAPKTSARAQASSRRRRI